MRYTLTDYPGVKLSLDAVLAELQFADDIFILGHGPNALQQTLDRVVYLENTMRLEYSTKKTKFLSFLVEVSSTDRRQWWDSGVRAYTRVPRLHGSPKWPEQRCSGCVSHFKRRTRSVSKSKLVSFERTSISYLPTAVKNDHYGPEAQDRERYLITDTCSWSSKLSVVIKYQTRW